MRKLLFATIAIILFSGCVSARYTSTENNKPSTFQLDKNIKFNLVNFKNKLKFIGFPGTRYPKIKRTQIIKILEDYYPEFFG